MSKKQARKKSHTARQKNTVPMAKQDITKTVSHPMITESANPETLTDLDSPELNFEVLMDELEAIITGARSHQFDTTPA